MGALERQLRDGMQKISLYDMDRTITVRGTYTPFLFHQLFARARWRLMFLPLLPFGFMGYGLKLISRGQLKTFNQRLLMGSGPKLADLQPHIDRFAENVLRSNRYQKALDQIEEDRAEGRTLVLVTASYELYAEAIARRLGFDHVIGTRLAMTAMSAPIPTISATGQCWNLPTRRSRRLRPRRCAGWPSSAAGPLSTGADLATPSVDG